MDFEISGRNRGLDEIAMARGLVNAVLISFNILRLCFRLALYVYEYLLHVGAQKAAQTFLSEVSSEISEDLRRSSVFVHHHPSPAAEVAAAIAFSLSLFPLNRRLFVYSVKVVDFRS
ncbi:single-stranded DNA-binding protein 4-like [Tropilaelaps mercedesae]|uniref:Single-stranded DNA-binding protein 4-like n=1 Tax=Tropilaelaps mercedesae TaxID=418985 RepID=A0A1V9X8S7_9ACAR|nr:single-stranded DNA-binding protein 4-like [Tropilaelaps mercedesae]